MEKVRQIPATQQKGRIITLEIPTKAKKSGYRKTKEELNTGSWCEENKTLKDIFYSTSYFAAFVSLSSAFFWVVDGVNTFTDMVWASYGIGAIALTLLELFDRISSMKVWKGWFFYRKIAWGWVVPAIGIFVGSLYLSIDGEQAAKEKAKASPEVIATNTLLEEKKAEKMALKIEYDKVKASPSSYKDPKTMLVMWWPTQGEQKTRTKRIESLSKEISQIEAEIKGENYLLTESHLIKVEKLGNVFLLLVIIFALLYQFCIAWLAYYKRKEYNEGELKEHLYALHLQGVEITPTLALNILEEIEKPLKKKLKIDLNF